MFHIILLTITHLLALLTGGFIYKANNQKSEKFLNDLAAKAAEGTEEAKVVILQKLSNLNK